MIQNSWTPNASLRLPAVKVPPVFRAANGELQSSPQPAKTLQGSLSHSETPSGLTSDWSNMNLKTSDIPSPTIASNICMPSTITTSILTLLSILRSYSKIFTTI